MNRLLILILWRISLNSIMILISYGLKHSNGVLAGNRKSEWTNRQNKINDDDTDACALALNTFEAILPLALCPFILLHQLISLDFLVFILHIFHHSVGWMMILLLIFHSLAFFFFWILNEIDARFLIFSSI